MHVAAEVSPAFDDSRWKASAEPLQMGADGDTSAFAWYRATMEAPAAGAGSLEFAGGGDDLGVFVNGKSCKLSPKGRSGPRRARLPRGET